MRAAQLFKASQKMTRKIASCGMLGGCCTVSPAFAENGTVLLSVEAGSSQTPLQEEFAWSRGAPLKVLPEVAAARLPLGGPLMYTR